MSEKQSEAMPFVRWIGEDARVYGIACPECGGLLYARFGAWRRHQPVASSIDVTCELESTHNRHRYEQSTWQSIIDKIRKACEALDD